MEQGLADHLGVSSQMQVGGLTVIIKITGALLISASLPFSVNAISLINFQAFKAGEWALK